VTQRASRYYDTDKLSRDKQKDKESRRSALSFHIRHKAKRSQPMTHYTCHICGLTFGSTWLNHCPQCGNPNLTTFMELQ
jgi:hypothetical protein